MRCETFREQVSPWLDDRLDTSAAAAFFAHSTSCTECRELLRARALLRSIIAQSNREERLPPLVADLLEAARNGKLQ